MKGTEVLLKALRGEPVEYDHVLPPLSIKLPPNAKRHVRIAFIQRGDEMVGQWQHSDDPWGPWEPLLGEVAS